jgi:hypothetical protein
MTNPFTKFICTLCGHSDQPCHHFLEHEAIRLLKEEMKFNRHALLEILHRLNRPQSATLTLQANQPCLVGDNMPATILVGATANSSFQEWTGPNGTGTVVPNAGAIAYTSSDPAVATVDPVAGVATGVSAGTATITGTDPVNNLTAGDTLTVNAVAPPPPPPPTAQSATLTLTAN